MRKRLATTVALASALALLGAAPAAADFGLSEFDVRFTKQDGGAATEAGTHPHAMETFFEVNYREEGGGFVVDGGDIKDLIIEQVRGFVGSATAVETCDSVDFATLEDGLPKCGDDTAVGVTAAILSEPTAAVPAPVYNLTPPPGVPARLGFVTSNVPLVIDVGVKESADYNIVATTANIPQPLAVLGAALQLWGVPADQSHDFARGKCFVGAFPSDTSEVIVDGKLNLQEGGPTCSAGGGEPTAFLTLPRSCEGPLATVYRLDPWSNPGAWVEGSALTHHGGTPPQPGGFTHCSKLEFTPVVASQATSDSAGTGTGLDFDLSFNQGGLVSATGTAQSEMKRVVVTLPRGMTVNPSVAEGLGVCTPADLDRETVGSAPGQGCPNASKLGTVEVQTPLLDDPVEGSVFLAQQDDPEAPGRENPFDSLIAIYIVLKNPDLGILVKQAGKVEPDPQTGQLVSTFDDIPQVPFSNLEFRFREGQRAPLINPSLCGTHTVNAVFTPHARPAETVTETADFQVTRGVGGGPCPAGGAPPFEPGFEAGTINNSAGAYSPFVMRLTRRDGDRDLSRFSTVLPPGVLAKLAGLSRCHDVAIAVAKAKSGRAELRAPSCPPSSAIGRSLAGAGVGSALTFVPGHLYLAGPYNGAPLSVVSVTPAVAGPFDAGTVVVRVALGLNPRTGEVLVDGAASDPIPHLLKGIPLKLRDLRVFVDRPSFTLNSTSCDPSATRATLFGSFLDLSDPGAPHGLVPVARSSRYQAANCGRLGFRPRLGLRLKGGTRRGANPGLRAVLRPRPGHANIERTVVRLPRSAFLDQSHIRTVCTRVQFAADACPRGAIYGRVVAHSPLLDEPLRGPAYLRSSNNKLPDLVFDLRGIVDIESSARIDSIRGGIRATFAGIPDAPLSKVVVRMQGGKKGLIVNSRNLCQGKNRVVVRFDAHNGKRVKLHPVLRPQCGKKRRAKGSRAGHAPVGNLTRR